MWPLGCPSGPASSIRGDGGTADDAPQRRLRRGGGPEGDTLAVATGANLPHTLRPRVGDLFFGRSSSREPSVRTILRVIVTVVLSVLALYVVYRLRTPIFYLLMAMLLATILSGPVAFLSRRMPKGLAITIVYLGVILIPIGIGAVLIPPLVRAVADLVSTSRATSATSRARSATATRCRT